MLHNDFKNTHGLQYPQFHHRCYIKTKSNSNQLQDKQKRNSVQLLFNTV